jgi:hypothetical protein
MLKMAQVYSLRLFRPRPDILALYRQGISSGERLLAYALALRPGLPTSYLHSSRTFALSPSRPTCQNVCRLNASHIAFPFAFGAVEGDDKTLCEALAPRHKRKLMNVIPLIVSRVG